MGDDSATTMGKAFARYTGGRGCYIPVIWDTGCSKSIISEEAVRALGSQITELDRSLKIISASGEALSIIGTVDIFIQTQVTSKKKRMLQCCVLRGNKQNPEILVSLEKMKELRIVHPTFGRQTIDDFLYNTTGTTFKNKYSELCNCNSIQFYQPTKTVLKEPTEEERYLRDKLIGKYSETFVDKLGPEDRFKVPPIKLEVDRRPAEAVHPTNHIKPYNVPFHLRDQFQKEVIDMLEVKIIERCEVATEWNTKAFPVAKADGTSCSLIGD